MTTDAARMLKAVQEGGSALEAPELAPTDAGARRRARSVTTALPGPAEKTPATDLAAKAAGRARAGFGRVVAASGVHYQPPTAAAAWALHRESASHWDAGLVRWPRIAWGAVHVAVVWMTNVSLAVAFSPAGFVVAVLFIVSCWFWL